MSRNPADLSLIGRKGAHALHAIVDDESAHTLPARTAFLERFAREVDPDQRLDPAVRAKRAQHALKSYMAGLALKSAQARRRSGGPDAAA
jgi:hypothetical protein